MMCIDWIEASRSLGDESVDLEHRTPTISASDPRIFQVLNDRYDASYPFKDNSGECGQN
jgi:hypothetical protein